MAPKSVVSSSLARGGYAAESHHCSQLDKGRYIMTSGPMHVLSWYLALKDLSTWHSTWMLS